MAKTDKDEKELKLMVREIEIMKSIKHPNCIEFYDTYETRSHFYIVMELVTGGQLLDRIIEKDHYSETEAANVFVQLLEGIDYLHSKGVVHRDLKPENILYQSPHPDSPIKIADFGLGRLVDVSDLESGRVRLWSRCGSPNYVAPEVLNRKGYGMECDIWSAGVILYICLSGTPPFDQGTVEKKFQHIKKADFGFPNPLWNGISEDAKHLITNMLRLDIEDRWNCRRCLDHNWVKRFHAGSLSKEGMPQMQSRLKEWNAQRKLMAAIFTCKALRRMSHVCELPDQEECAERLAQLKLDPALEAQLKESWELLDRDHKGKINLEDLTKTVQVFGERKGPNEVKEMMEHFSVFHKEGEICFEEYCIMMCPHSSTNHAHHSDGSDELSKQDSHFGHGSHDHHVEDHGDEEEMLETFQAMDIKGQGTITPEALKEVLMRFGSGVSDLEATEMVKIADTKGDGVIDFEEFRDLLCTTALGSSRRRSQTLNPRPKALCHYPKSKPHTGKTRPSVPEP